MALEGSYEIVFVDDGSSDGTLAALRAAARFSLGSVSSDIELMERLLSSQAWSGPEIELAKALRSGSCLHDCANGRSPQGVMLRTSPFVGKRRSGQKTQRHAIVSAIIMPPHFRPPPAAPECDKIPVRWPGPFGSGFLSPQPPGIVRIGPVPQLRLSILGQRKLVLFRYGYRCGARFFTP